MIATRTFTVDRLHGRVRLATLAVWVVSWVVLLALGAVVAQVVFGDQSPFFWLVWAVITLWVSQFPSRWAETRLAVAWPSPRRIALTAESLVLHNSDGDVTLTLDKPIQRTTWCFKIQRQRGAHVPAGNYCLAARWAQSGREIVVYCFASPDESQGLRADVSFYELLSSRDRSGNPTAGAPGSAARGRSDLYLAAEAGRYEHGGEVSYPDFAALVQLAPH